MPWLDGHEQPSHVAWRGVSPGSGAAMDGATLVSVVFIMMLLGLVGAMIAVVLRPRPKGLPEPDHELLELPKNTPPRKDVETRPAQLRSDLKTFLDEEKEREADRAARQQETDEHNAKVAAELAAERQRRRPADFGQGPGTLYGARDND